MLESPTRQLADDHEYVLLVVGAMAAEADRIERTDTVDTARVSQMVDFTRNFTDGDHHTKEENLLFPLLEERSPAAGGTISVLLSEHQAARDCIRAVDGALRSMNGQDGEKSAAAPVTTGSQTQAATTTPAQPAQSGLSNSGQPEGQDGGAQGG